MAQGKKWPDRRFARLRMAYSKQKHAAKIRGISFLLSFEEWLHVWETSGHLHERGCKRGQYVMARIGDIGPYAYDSVKIIVCSDNNRECAGAHTYSSERRKKMANTLRGRTLSQQHREAISRGVAAWHSRA